MQDASVTYLFWLPILVREILLAQQSLLPRHADGRIAGFDAELIVYRAQVRIHRAATDNEPLRNFRVAQLLDQETQYFKFARGQ